MKKYLTIIHDFLTKNTSSKQIVIKNTFWLLLAEGISKGSLAILVIMIGRIFGKEIFGQYSYLSVILTFLVVFADMGLTQLAVRDYQHIDEKSRRQYLVTGLWTKILLSLAVVAVYIVILRYTADTSFLWMIGLILLTNNLTNSFLEYIRSTFRSLQKGETELRIKLIQGIGNLLLIPLLYVYESLPLNLLGQSIVTLVTIGYARWLVHKRQLVDHQPEVIVTKGELVRNGWMFSAITLLSSLYVSVDQLMLKEYISYEDLGPYSASTRLFQMITLPAGIITSLFITEFSKTKNYDSILITLRKLLIIPILLGSISFFTFYFFGSFISTSLFGDDFREMGVYLKYFAFMLLFIYINTIFASILQGLGRNKEIMIFGFFGLVINIMLNLYLLRSHGAIGASISTLITEIFTNLGITIYAIYYLKNKTT